MEASAAFVRTIEPREDKRIQAMRAKDGPAIELLYGETPDAEAEHIVSRINKLVECGHRYGDVAVLYPSVRSSAKRLIRALRSSSIPAAPVGRLSLLDRPELALLARVFVLWGSGTWYPEDEREVVIPERLAEDIADLTGKSPVESERIVADLERMGREFGVKGVPDLIGAYLEMLDKIGLPVEGPERARQERGLGQLSELLTDFEHAQRRTALPRWYEEPAPAAAEEADEDKILNSDYRDAEAAVAALPNYAPGEIYLRRLRIFFEEFASSAIEEAPDNPVLERDAVNMMTIHKAKGLEFPIVFMPPLVERRFPSARMGQEQRWYVPEGLFDRRATRGARRTSGGFSTSA